LPEDSAIRFRDAELAEWLRDRAERMPFARDRRSTEGSAAGGQARTELALWRAALEAELSRVRLTLAQASCVADVLNGTVLDAALGAPLGLAYAGCYDAFRLAREVSPGVVSDVSSYGAKWGPEGCDPAKWEQDLLGCLGTLGPVADHALRDAIARWWALPGEPLPGDAAGEEKARFAAVGLRVTEGR
jgi:hypothetical protein